jgi:hypothetical protein
MRAGVAQGGLVSPVLFSLYVNDMPTPSRHVDLALYADDTALIATSRNPLLLIRYLGDLSQQTRVLATGLEDRYLRLKEHSRALYQDHETRPKTQTTPAFRRANTIG